MPLLAYGLGRDTGEGSKGDIHISNATSELPHKQSETWKATHNTLYVYVYIYVYMYVRIWREAVDKVYI